MYRIVELDEDNRQNIIRFLERDPVRHVFALYDIQHELANTRMYVCFDNEDLEAYILIYRGTTFPSVILEGKKEVAESLLEYAPKSNFILHAPKNLLPLILERFPNAKYYIEDWMLVNRGHVKFFRSQLVRILSGLNDAERLMKLFSTDGNRPKESLEKNLERISKTPVYGVFVDEELVSCAAAIVRLPKVWLVGGVYTHPSYRNKGYATLAASAVTEEALKTAECASLIVRRDNFPAIRVYEKIGYRKVGEKIWIDMGTGLKP
ncbi:MAG: GNAT family N-acetyltransferase [Candidatus Bathyarchaeia archaeon]